MSENKNALMEISSARDLPIGVVADAFVASGYFDTQSIRQAAVKIMAGQELGLGPFAAMRGINIIKGRPHIGADVLAAKLREHPRYDYVVDELTRERCTVHIREKQADGTWRDCPPYTFTMDDAKKADLTGRRGNQPSLYELYPARMLFTVVIAHVQRIYAPDALAFTGYTEGEQPAFDSPSPMAEGRHRPEPAARPEPMPEPKKAKVVEMPKAETPPMPSVEADFEEVADEPTPEPKTSRRPSEAIAVMVEKAADSEPPDTLAEFVERKRLRKEFLESLVTDENRAEIESWADYPGGVEAQAKLVEHYEDKVGDWPWGEKTEAAAPAEEPKAEPGTPTMPTTDDNETDDAALPFDLGDVDDDSFAD